MSDGQTLVVKLKVNSDGLVEGLQAAGRSTEGAAQQFKTSFRDTAGATQEAARAHEGFLGTLKEFKAEQVQAGRVANFYATQLTEIVPGADGAKGAVKGLIAAFAGGSLVGGAVELAVVGFGKLNEVITESQKQAAELRKTHVEGLNAVRDAVQNAAHAYDGWKTATQGVAQQLEEGVNSKVRALRQQVDEIHAETKDSLFGDVLGTDADKIAQIRAQVLALQSALKGSKGQKLLGDLQDKETTSETERVNKEIVGLTASMGSETFRIKTETEQKAAALQRQIGTATAQGLLELAQRYEQLKEAVETEGAERVKKLKLQNDLAYRTQTVALTNDLVSEEQRIRDEGALKVQALRAQLAGGLEPIERQRIETEIKLEEDKTRREAGLAALAAENKRRATIIAAQQTLDAETAAKAQQAKKLQDLEDTLKLSGAGNIKAAQLQAVRDEEMAEEQIVREAAAKHIISAQQLEEDLAAIKKKGSDKRAEITLKENEWIRAGYEGLTRGFDSAVQGLIAGHKSLADSVVALSKSVLQSLLQVAEKIVMANAVRAASAAFADTAQTGLIGLLAAPAAMAAALGLVSGLVGSLPSAAGGFDIPAGSNPITQLHEREMVLPAPIADTVRNAMDGGGVGGGDVHLHIHSAYADAAGLKAFFSSGAVERAINEARRNGRSI